MRLFIAIDIKELEPFFKELQKQIPLDLAKVKLTDSFHLTLKFLGEVSEQKIEYIKKALHNVAFKEFFLTFNHIGFFPDENYIRVVWVGVKEAKDVKDLQKDIDTSFVRIFTKEQDFHPHITLGRVKYVKDKSRFVSKIREIKVEEHTILVKSFKLIKSTLKGEGPLYEDLTEFRTH
jgi:2'-5' RNA ligase